MITIQKFSNQPHHLADVIMTMRQSASFELFCVWEYDADQALQVRLIVRSSEMNALEDLLCSELNSNGFLFSREFGPIQKLPAVASLHSTEVSQQHYLFVPMKDCFPRMFTPATMGALLSVLLNEGNRLRVHLVADAKMMRASLSVVSTRFPFGVCHAFGNCFLATPASGGEAFFDASDELLEALLQLPFVPAEGSSLITGYGGKEQAVEHSKPSDVIIGSILGDVLGRNLLYSKENMKNSLLVSGISGYGKTTCVSSIIAQTYRKKNIPFLCIEPAKAEYKTLRKAVPDLIVIDDMSKFNFLIPPNGVPGYLWSDIIAQMISTAMHIPGDSTLPIHLRDAYELCFRANKLLPGYLGSAFKHLTKDISSNHADYKTYGRYLIDSFFKYLNGPSYSQKQLLPFSIEQLLERPCIINLGNIPSPQLKACLILFLIQHLRAYLQKHSESEIRNLLILEEAHHILGKEQNQQLLTEVCNVLREARAQGLSTIVVDQSISTLYEPAVNQMGNYISFRQTSSVDQESMAASLLCEGTQLNELPKYTAFVRLNGMQRAETVKILNTLT